ncbi:MAG TPA: restriction endonuclease subunit M [Bacteroidetes bacterium]|nr:restriction endonuclease subunit M [Bacteroidota bacterium]HRI46945.1 TaqI-like C-terminal specificity domain-containing protein [Ignavibacteriaceae bacterium]
MEAPQEIIQLVTRFKDNLSAYKNPGYNETQVRREFIDPLFELLGWDIANKSGYAEAYKEVIHEYSQKTKDSVEAPDYLFRIGGIRKFFVEAKKPSVNLKDDPNPAFQVRRYAWSAKLPLSILTDFEEFIVYDCRIKPVLNDKPSNGRILYYTFEDYITKWDEIYSVFSREAILKGSFDRFADSKRNKKGTAEVDDEFLSEIENWRDHLAKNLALRNPELTNRELNFAVQKTIDRIIFLRICEDRGIEDYGQLLNLLNGANIYKRLLQIFSAADQKYNSGLFYFEQEKNRGDYPDTISHKLNIDDKTLKDIIKKLYYPESPYEFSVLPADILGHVYEQFLGKVIRLTAGHRAIVEEKPEVKKAGGVYYTPTYIVEYIVNNTLGVKLDEINSGNSKLKNKIDEASKLKVLDPACGSGSFLLGAYQYLLDWHLKLYSDEFSRDNFIPKKESPVYKTGNNELKLTTAERKRILLNNIFGVDIDSQAVEVTKLSLMLKVLEGETGETLNTQLTMFRQRALPDLSNNIKCGNSLIGPDFYDQMEMNFLDDEGKYKINVFDWHSEFKEIFNNGGFDVVIGNPPYGYMISNPEQKYFSDTYKHQNYQKDLYLLFLERYESLLRERGTLGVIISNTWLQSLTFTKIRVYLRSTYSWRKFLFIPQKVFKAVVDTHVIIFDKEIESPHKEMMVKIDVLDKNTIHLLHEIKNSSFPNDGSRINIVANPIKQNLYNKIMQSNKSIKDNYSIFNGVKPFEKGKGKPPQTEKILKEKPYVKEGCKPGDEWRPLLRGSLINRYCNNWNSDYWILYGEWLAAPRNEQIFNKTVKIFIRQTGDSIIATIVGTKFIARNNIHIIIDEDGENLYPLLGILNSKLIGFLYSILNPERGEALAEVKKYHIEMLPLINLEKNHLRILDLNSTVKNMILLHTQLNKFSTPQEKQTLQRQIEATDKQIDKLVYELYGLTEEEIRIVEESQ